MKKLDYIDALRGLAILGVVIVHVSLYGRSITHHPTLYRILLEGGRGVQLFFLASAFTLFLSLNKGHKGESSPLRNFFIRRFFRIAPMYYVGIIYYLLQEGLGPRYWLGDATHVTAANILSNFTFLHGFNPHWISSVVPGGWSIAVEMSFYVILPFLFSRIKNLNQAFNFFIISLILRFLLESFFAKFQLISHDQLWTNYLFLYFPSQLPIFALGIMMYFIIVENQNLFSLSGKSLLLMSILIVAQISSGINFIFPNHVLFGIAFLILGIALSKPKQVLVVNPVIIYIGKISFSMYIVHFAILHWLTQWGFIDYAANDYLNVAIRFLIVLILTVMIASVFYFLVEVPFQKIGKKLIDRLEKKQKNLAV